MNTGSADEQIAKVLAGFSGENHTSPPSGGGFGANLDSVAEGFGSELPRAVHRVCDEHADRLDCECNAGATDDERRPAAAEACGNDLFGEFDFDPRTLGALVDIESEVCLADWENPSESRRERDHRPQLMIGRDLELVTTAPSARLSPQSTR
jgi:hypothetical protein